MLGNTILGIETDRSLGNRGSVINNDRELSVPSQEPCPALVAKITHITSQHCNNITGIIQHITNFTFAQYTK